ncbi:MAG: cytochrome c-type biogenesis protein [Phyllobacterium sp.]
MQTLLLAGVAHAVNPDEVLGDPALEARARTISAELRCMVCQNQSIDDSDAALAKDLRVLVRERLVAGDSDEEVIDFIVARYGEFILLKPRFGSNTIVLWGLPIAILAIGGVLILAGIRKKRMSARQPAPLSDDERKQVDRLLAEKDE